MVDFEYTDSQMRCYRFLKNAPDYRRRLEYIDKDLKPYKDIPLRENWKIDIALFHRLTNERIAIELDGGPHDKYTQQGKDLNKRLTLQYNGWTVLVINYQYIPKLWSGEEGWQEELEKILSNTVKFNKMSLVLQDNKSKNN